MTITLVAHRTTTDGGWECSFQTLNPASESQKATIFLGHPKDRHTTAVRRTWKVSLPESASLQDDAVIWFSDEKVRMLSANEVFEYAQNQMHGFAFLES